MKSLFTTWLLHIAFVFPLLYSPLQAQNASGSVADINDDTAVLSQVPPQYYDNYFMNNARESIQDKFVQINAAKNTGIGLDSTFFSALKVDFDNAFPYFPNQSKYRVTYEQCRLLTNQLITKYSRDVFAQFIQGCHKPLEQDMQEMKSKYTIKAHISASPDSGPLPLTVTFDARDSVDPSIVTIPSANYFRYYKDVYGIDQIIGQGPVISYTFTEPGNHIVYLTVRSANQKTEGILDGSATTTISVEPEAANIVLFANGRTMDEKNITKIGTVEAQKGVTFDASGTTPKGGRVITQHSRNVTSDGKTLFSKSLDGAPGIVSVQFPHEGQFGVSLTVQDNQNNTLTRNYKLAIADPLAIIKQSPEVGNTSTTFRFDATSSYSLVSKIRQYTRDIIDPHGTKTETLQSKSISKQFSLPGPYKIQLTVEDEQGRKNIETLNLMVESTEPLAQFSIEPADDWKYPSQFYLDASLSSDIDVLGADDTLTYQRKFNPEQNVIINDILDDGQKILVSFEEKGDYSAQLTVSDNYGKVSDIEKTITVESTLRPQLFISPIATFRGGAVRCLVKTNKNTLHYVWDMGDGDSRELSEPTLVHSYDKVGVYPISLTAYTEDGESNTITKPVFIGEKNSPVIAYEVKDKTNHILKQNDVCMVDGQEQPSFSVARGQDIEINVSHSVNTKGEKKGLTIHYQPQDDDIYTQKNLKYRFLDLGCRFIDIKAEDTEAGVITNQRAWFKVVNDLPTLQNLTLLFPQYGNSVGIGLGLTNQKKQDTRFDANDFTNLIVKVVAQGANDTDGSLAFFKRYYFNKENPSRILETKITPTNVPETYFTLQKIPGEYEFGVTLVDNDGGESPSESIIGHGPTVFFPPDSKNLDIPIVTLRQSAVTAKVGEEITFDVVAKLLTQRPDFEASKTIKFDFDSDGEFDLPPTKETSATYYFTEPGTYTPSVKVIYRGIPGIARGEPITVEDGLMPLLLTESAGTLVIGREVSIGKVASSSVCLDQAKCNTDPQMLVSRTQTGENENSMRMFIHDYQEPGEYTLSLDVTDAFGNMVNKKHTITLTQTGGVDQPFISIPYAQHEEDQSIITVGRQLHDAIVFYLPYAGSGDCFLDVDITNDSDGDQDTKNDHDISCNKIQSHQYSPLFDSVLGRWQYEDVNGKQGRDVLVNFLDKRIELSKEYVQVYQDITNLIPLLDGTDPDISYIKSLLLTLRNNLDDSVSRGSSLVALHDYVQKHENKLTDKEKNRIDVIIFTLSDGDISAAIGGNAYEQAKQDILLLMPGVLKENIVPLFEQIDNADGDRDTIKSSLQEILNILKTHQGGDINQIDPKDMDLIIMPKVCQILSFFDIASETCKGVDYTPIVEGTGNNTKPPVSTSTGGITLQTILKGIMWLVIAGVVVVGGLFGRYLIKSKIQNDEDDEYDESDENSDSGE